MRILIKTHKVKIVSKEIMGNDVNSDIKILDDGIINGYEDLPEKIKGDILKSAQFVQKENDLKKSFNKRIRKPLDEFEMEVKYLVE